MVHSFLRTSENHGGLSILYTVYGCDSLVSSSFSQTSKVWSSLTPRTYDLCQKNHGISANSCPANAPEGVINVGIICTVPNAVMVFLMLGISK